MTCPLCGCPMHDAAQTWEPTCMVCGELRWPYAVRQPDPATYVCGRCRAVPPERRAGRLVAAEKRAVTRRRKAAGVVLDSRGEALGALPDSQATG